MKNMPETACFLFVEQEVDKRGRLYKAVKEKGRVAELGIQDEKTLLYWIAGNMKREGKKIRESSARYLISRVGDRYGESGAGDGKAFFPILWEGEEITPQDIDAICTGHITNQILCPWWMLWRPDSRERRWTCIMTCLALKEPPMRILYLVTRQFKLLLEVGDMVRRGYDKSRIAGEGKTPPLCGPGNACSSAGLFRKKDLRGILEEAADIEEKVKTGRLMDRMGVELFIVKNSGM